MTAKPPASHCQTSGRMTVNQIAQQSLAAVLLFVIASVGAQQAPVPTDEAVVRSALPVTDLTQEQAGAAARLYCVRHVPGCTAVDDPIRINYAWMFTPLFGNPPKLEKGRNMFGKGNIEINAETGGIGREGDPSYGSLEMLLSGKP